MKNLELWLGVWKFRNRMVFSPSSTKEEGWSKEIGFFLLLTSTELEIILNSFRCFTDDFRLLKPTTSAVGFLNKVKGLN